MQLLLGNRIVITGRVLPGFQRKIWFSGSEQLNLGWDCIGNLSSCLCFPLGVCCISPEHRRVSPPRFGDSHRPLSESWTVGVLGVMDSQFSKYAGDLCFLSSCRMMLSLVLLMSSNQPLQIFFFVPLMGMAGVKDSVMELARSPQVL